MSCKSLPTAVKRVHPNATLPVYATSGAAAADVTCVSWKDTEGNWQTGPVMVNPGKSVILDTGLQFAVPSGHELKCYSRSGHGFKNGIRLSNCTGILDSDYRGNLMVKLHNDSDTAFRINMGERVLQVQVKKAPQNTFYEVLELSETERGAGGFGSTGTKQIGAVNVGVEGAHQHTISVNNASTYDHSLNFSDGTHVHTIVDL